MKPANDNTRTTRRTRLDDLPLYATDVEIGQAVVGHSRAAAWARDYLPRLANQPGFPVFDQAHGGRYVPAVRVFYDQRNGIGSAPLAVRDSAEDTSGWRGKRRAG